MNQLKQRALPVLFAYTMLPLLLLLLLLLIAAMVAHDSQPLAPPFIVDVIGAAALLSGAIFATSKLRPDLPDRNFLTTMMVSLAITEFGGLLAFTLLFGSRWITIAPVMGGNVAVNVFVIAPRVFAFSRQ
ncbi:MAG TPA: hypothetical protein VHE55_10725 [Fimbriimonadaceae bacterium]|nr:hypothetical protein [Fimbriimonadaceae bacterium]